MTDREKFIVLVNSNQLKKSDAIILLEGDGYNRLSKAVELYQSGWARRIVVSGNFDNSTGGNFPAALMKKKLSRLGIPARHILIEGISLNTREQAVEVMKMAKKNKWRRLLLVASLYHQFRAYLTFLKAMEEQRSKIEIINAPASDLSWFGKNPWGRRIDLLDMEFKKIDLYRKKGHIATFKYVINYQSWKEKR